MAGCPVPKSECLKQIKN